MQIIFQVSKLKCFFVYQRTTLKEVNDELDEKFIELALRLSTQISSQPFEITINPNIGFNDFVPVGFQTFKTINLIFRCFDKSIGGIIIREETVPVSLCFDAIIDEEIVHRLFKEDQYVNLEPNICGLLYTLVRD